MNNPSRRLLILCLFIKHASALTKKDLPKSNRHNQHSHRYSHPRETNRVRGLKESNVFGDLFREMDDKIGGVTPIPHEGEIRTFDTRGKMRSKGKKEDYYYYETIPELNSPDWSNVPESSEDFTKTDLPTPAFTSRPTPQPTESVPPPDPPTFFPYPEPETPNPTARPISQPIPSPTQSPSDARTNEPTQSPTLEPVAATPSPSQLLPTTTAPSPIPPAVPDVICRADKNGQFGTMSGDAIEVDYLFQMELFPGVTTKEAIEQIEKMLVDFLLSDLFPDDCAPPIKKEFWANPIDVRQSGFYNGITTDPQDTVANGFECIGVFLEPCFVVHGFLTVFSEFKAIDEVVGEIASRIYAILDSGYIEKDLIDVDKVTPLRDVDMSPESLDVSPDPLDSADYPVSAEDSRLRKFQDTPQPTSSTTTAPSGSQNNDAQEIEKRLFFFKLPWWIWLCVAVWLVTVWGLKTTVCILLQEEEGYKEQSLPRK